MERGMTNEYKASWIPCCRCEAVFFFLLNLRKAWVSLSSSLSCYRITALASRRAGEMQDDLGERERKKQIDMHNYLLRNGNIELEVCLLPLIFAKTERKKRSRWENWTIDDEIEDPEAIINQKLNEIIILIIHVISITYTMQTQVSCCNSCY